MKTLSEYLEGEGAPTLTALSASLGISKGRLSQLRHSQEWPAALALKAEKVTQGAISASSLSETIAKARDGKL